MVCVVRRPRERLRQARRAGPSAQKIPPIVNPPPVYSKSDATPSISAMRAWPASARVTVRSLMFAPSVSVGVNAPVDTTV